jgi:ribosomal protein S18 acetylase RimI-like enzyme
MSLAIRTATTQDYDAICQLYAAGDTLHAELLPERFVPAAPARATTFLAERLAGYPSTLLVATLAETLVGLLELRVVEIPDLPPVVKRTYLSIESLVVAPPYRRSGIGSHLLSAAETYAQQHHIDVIELNVFVCNQSAVRLYEQHGYQQLSIRMHKRTRTARDAAEAEPMEGS